MKILFCTNTFEKISNGPSKFAHLLLNESGRAGFETRILTEEVSGEMPGVYKLDLRIPKFFRLFGQFIRMWKYHKAAMKIRKEFEFDYLVYNNAMIGLLSTRFFGRTVGMINDDNNAQNSLIAVLKGNAKFNKRVIFNFVEYVTCHLSRGIIVNSEYLKKNLAERYSCKESLFKVMHKGIENNLVSVNREEILTSKIPGSVLFVKTDFLRGGLFTLIEAIRDLDCEIKLCVIGVAEEYHDQLKSLLNETNVSYELYGYICPDVIFQKMRESEIFCVPSKLEAFGVANLEAMAMACKIVTTNIGGIPEAVGGDRFAWLVEPDNSIALRHALQRALNSSIKDRLNEISGHLRNFSSANVISRFKSILETCF